MAAPQSAVLLAATVVRVPALRPQALGLVRFEVSAGWSIHASNKTMGFVLFS